MLKISEFFKRIKSKHSQEIFVRSVIQLVVKKHTEVEVPIGAIYIKSGIITVKGISSVARSQIFVKKQAMIQEINSTQKPHTFGDIR